MKNLTIMLLTILFFTSCQKRIPYEKNYYLINGKYHVFKLFTPEGWINNMNQAQQFGLVNLFVPNVIIVGSNNNTFWVSIYANGIDYQLNNIDYSSLIKKEKENYNKLSSNIKIIETQYFISNTSNIVNYIGYSIENIPKIYK